MASARFIFEFIKGNFEEQALKLQKPIAKAATAAVKEAGKLVKAEAKRALSQAGFGRVSNAMRTVVKPKTGDSIESSVEFFLRPAYLNVFEKGAAIRGRPLLWIPLDTVPFGDRGRRLTPQQYIERIGPLHSARGTSKPLLVGKGSRAGILRATSKAVRLRKGAVRAGRIQGTTNVPLFVGVPAINITKRLELREIVRKIGDQIGDLYLKNFKAD